MKEYNYIMPEQCQKCGTIFDLYYEFLESKERLENEEIQDKLGRELVESLCWGCKKQIINSLEKPSEETVDEINELFLDYE